MSNKANVNLEQTYTVHIKPITDSMQLKSLNEALDRVEAMKKKLDYFHETILVGYKEATVLLATLQKAGILRHESEKNQTDENVIVYLDLLNAIKAEIERERLILETIKTTQEEKTIEVNEPAAAEFDTFIAQKVKNAKVQTKKIESSLRVSFSRYHHWINQTVTRLKQIQSIHATPRVDTRAE